MSSYDGATGDLTVSSGTLWCPSEGKQIPLSGPGSLSYDEAKDELTDGPTTYRRVDKPVYVGLVDPTQGFWHLRDGMGSVKQFFYGNPGDFPILGDWNCNGVDTPGMYRQSDGFVYLRNSNSQGIADIRFFFGNPGDIPIVGDFNNNGCAPSPTRSTSSPVLKVIPDSGILPRNVYRRRSSAIYHKSKQASGGC